MEQTFHEFAKNHLAEARAYMDFIRIYVKGLEYRMSDKTYYPPDPDSPVNVVFHITVRQKNGFNPELTKKAKMLEKYGFFEKNTLCLKRDGRLSKFAYALGPYVRLQFLDARNETVGKENLWIPVTPANRCFHLAKTVHHPSAMDRKMFDRIKNIRLGGISFFDLRNPCGDMMMNSAQEFLDSESLWCRR